MRRGPVVVLALLGVAACSLVLPLREYDRDTDVPLTDATTTPPIDALVEAGDGGVFCTADGESCGECGRSCGGRACRDGSTCAPRHALDGISVSAIALGDGGIYVAFPLPEGLARIPLDLFSPSLPPLLSLPGSIPSAITTSDDRVLWGDFAGRVSSVNLALEPSSVRLESEGGPPLVAQLQTSLGPIWTSPGEGGKDGGVYRAGVAFADVPFAWGLTLDGDDVYWGARRPGGPIGKVGQLALIVDDAGAPINLAADATHIYWADCQGSAIRKVDPQTRQITTLAEGQLYPYAIAVDSTQVYWTTLGVVGTPESCSAQRLLPDGTASAQGTVVRARKDGTGLLVLAAEQELPLSLAVRDDLPDVYWASLAQNPRGGIWSVPK